MLINLDGQGTKSTQIYRAIRQQILNSVLISGQQLPSSREMAKTLACARNTVVNAYEQLTIEGYIHGSVGSGSFVTESLPVVMQQPEPVSNVAVTPVLSAFARHAVTHYSEAPHSQRPEYDFRYGVAGFDAISRKAWQRCTQWATNRIGTQYCASNGDENLRNEVSQYVSLNRGVRCNAGQVIIFNGSQQALSLISRVLLEPSNSVILEDPCYRGARQAFGGIGCKLLPVSVDEQGLICSNANDKNSFDKDVTPQHLADENMAAADLAYVTPSHQFPTGAIMSLKRRLQLLAWAERNNAYIVEDDYDSDYRYDTAPLPAIQGLDKNQRVIYLGTFSKTLSPALRLGYGVFPQALVEAMIAAKGVTDRHTSGLLQIAMARFMCNGEYERHLRRQRKRLMSLRTKLIQALQNHLPSGRIQASDAGLHVVLWLPMKPNSIDLKTLKNKFGIYPVNSMYQNPPTELGLMIGFSLLKEGDIETGIRRLSCIIDAAQG